MYNVGFGDAFLLIFPDGDERPRRVLIDCGTHMSGPRPAPDAPRSSPRSSTTSPTRTASPRIDLVVGTHRHSDHVSGFDRADWARRRGRRGLDAVDRGQERPEGHARSARRSPRRPSTCARRSPPPRAPEAKLALALADNALINCEAMKTLHHGFTGPRAAPLLPRPSGTARPDAPTFLPGVRVHVLGPTPRPRGHPRHGPARGRELPAARGRRRRTAAGPRARSPPDWETRPTARCSPKPTASASASWASVDPLAVAVALEKAVNGTSLVLAFEIGDALLLFPGDAQWGTWKAMTRRSGRRRAARAHDVPEDRPPRQPQRDADGSSSRPSRRRAASSRSRPTCGRWSPPARRSTGTSRAVRCSRRSRA